MENIELFLRACINYGMEVIDTFQVKDLYEARAMYTVSHFLKPSLYVIKFTFTLYKLVFFFLVTHRYFDSNSSRCSVQSITLIANLTLTHCILFATLSL